MWLLLVVSAAAPAQIYLQYSRVLCGSLCPSSPTIYSPDSSERGVDCGEEPGGCGGLTRIMQNMQSPSFMGNMLCHLRPAEDGCFSRNRGGSEPTQATANFPAEISIFRHKSHKSQMVPMSHQHTNRHRGLKEKCLLHQINYLVIMNMLRKQSVEKWEHV